MLAGGGRRNQTRARLRCSYCQRSFARAEHLTRHERSRKHPQYPQDFSCPLMLTSHPDRNEKPFKCSHCESTFSRKDVIKRHHLRYHSALPRVDSIMNLALPVDAPVGTAAPAVEETSLPAQPEDQSAQEVPETTSTVHMEAFPDDSAVLHFMSQPSISSIDQIDFFLGGGDFPFSTDDTLLGGWRGSCEISTDKRQELEKEVQAAFAQSNEMDSLRLPSCLAFERLLNNCFEFFLTYLPFVHVPTWRAESAHPTLLIAMASLSSCHNGDSVTAQALYRAGRSSVIKHIDSDFALSTEEQPEWLIQSILILIAYGIADGKRKPLDEALSWASLFATILRHQKAPEFNDFGPNEDIFTRWKTWIDCETSVRTKCAGFVILNNLSICYNAAPALLNREMGDAPLPCRESDWAATTPATWLEARNQVQGKEICLNEALGGLLSSSQPQSNRISSFGAYVMLHAIVQRMWRLQPEIWTRGNTWDFFQASILEASSFQASGLAIRKWQAFWEEDSECSLSSRNPHGAVSMNAAALLRLAHMRLHTDFSSVRSAIVSLDAMKISQSMKELCIKIDRSNSTLRTAVHALQSLRTRIRLGMALKTPGRAPSHSLQLHLVSIECCLFASAWMREVSSRPEYKRTSDEKDCMELGAEILAEVDIGQSNKQKPQSTQLIYAWALVLESSAVWGIQTTLADALKNYAESQSWRLAGS
ncbi:hypothetical protein BGZ61DRAFT_574854 [Ilyonectria robusta]|uniref:uncharacterized protein n=1 Tax=Ilyonectria robusta TaxID=1079257 RepID=UPI001E8CBE66|nr:uncharacterized protein BGZ61DRAFT_574854 [Ilyonectria robusta]KAH8714773.1 hypothetical protein BGZ61DRAFT_574854 [Ilyonectria robusta]